MPPNAHTVVLHPKDGSAFELAIVGPAGGFLCIPSPWPPKVLAAPPVNAMGYWSSVFKHRSAGDYHEMGEAMTRTVVMCDNGHLPEPLMYSANPEGPFVCSACRTGSAPPPTLEDMAIRMAKLGDSPKGSTPPVRGVREAVLATEPTPHDARRLGDGDPSLWADEPTMAKIIAAESVGAFAQRGIVLIFDLQTRRWEDRYGFASWWPGANVGCVQWCDSTWFTDNTTSVYECIADFNRYATP